MKAFFFDRDGTLNIDPGYINNPLKMKFFPYARNVLEYIKSLGYKIFIITNQSGIGRGIIKPEEYRKVSENFLSMAGGYRIIDDVLYCPHTPANACSCRKPLVFLLKIIYERYNINSEKSYFVGDKITDIICGKNAGLKTIMIFNDTLKKNIPLAYEDRIIEPDKIINSVSELLTIIKE